tara:strand:- start:1380 stop:2117 length:738 start_codon:yes stop_codon:yes gene_type:complete
MTEKYYKSKLVEQILGGLKRSAKAPFRGMDVAEKSQLLNLNVDTGLEIARNMERWVGNLPEDEELPLVEALSQNDVSEPVSTVPAVKENLPSKETLAGLKWQKIGHLPGYAVGGIRAMGRDIFRSLECFQAFDQKMKLEGKDALAETLIVSDWTHDETTVNALTKMIVENGCRLNTGVMDHPQIPDYAPEVIMFMTKDWTFKLVRDRRSNGAPVDLNSIYAWPGGTSFYERKLRPVAVVSAPKLG